MPTASETTSVSLSFGGSDGVGVEGVGVVDGSGDVDGVETGVEAGVVAGVDDGVSVTGLEAGVVVGVGVAPPTFSRYQAAANPSLPPGSRTCTH